VLFLFKGPNGWGTVAKSRDPGLNGRRPLFRSLRNLVYSYVDPFVDYEGRIIGYGTLDLQTLKRTDWRLSPRNVWTVQEALIRMPHRRLRTSNRRYRRWFARYKAFKKMFPEGRPTYFAGRRRWW